MDLKFLGNRNYKNNNNHNHTSSYLIKNETMLLINVGINIHDELKRLNILKDIKKIKIIITSMDYKNTSTLASLITELHDNYNLKKNEIIIITSKGINIPMFLELQGINQDIYTYLEVPKKTNLKELNISIDFFETKHNRLNILNYGFVLSNALNKIVYLPDTIDRPSFIEDYIKDNIEFKLYISVYKEEDYCSQIECLSLLFKDKDERKKVYFMDLNEVFTSVLMYKVKSLGFNIVYLFKYK